MLHTRFTCARCHAASQAFYNHRVAPNSLYDTHGTMDRLTSNPVGLTGAAHRLAACPR